MTIVLFWLGMTALLFYQEVWPLLQPNAPPPFTIDLVDEARSQQSQVRWFVYLEGTKPDSNMVAKTEVKYNELAGYKVTDMSLDAARFDGVPDLVRAKLNPIKDRPYDEQGFLAALSGILSPRERELYQAVVVQRGHEKFDDSFTFGIQLNCVAGQPPPGRFHVPQVALPGRPRVGNSRGLALGPLTLRTMSSYYRITRAGQLLSMEVDFHFDLSALRQNVPDVDAHLDGEIVEDEFRSRVELWETQFGEYKKELPPVKIVQQGAVLMPMHPVNRIKGLRRGQHWRMPLVDPLANAALATRAAFGLGGKMDDRQVNCRVLPQPQLLPDVKDPPSCLVVEYDDEETQPRTWVEEGTGLVMRQEANVMGTRLIMQRETVNLEP